MRRPLKSPATLQGTLLAALLCSLTGCSALAADPGQAEALATAAAGSAAPCARTPASKVQVVQPGSGNAYAFTQYGKYSVQVDDWGNMPGTTIVWSNSPGCWGTSITHATEQYNIPISPEVSRGWTANAGVLQANSTAGYPANPNWTTRSGLGLKVSDITKLHAKWAMVVPTAPNVGNKVSRWDALLDVYFHTAAQGAPNPPASAWPPQIDLQIYQMLMDQPLVGQLPQHSGYWAGSFLHANHAFTKTIGGNTYIGVIDKQIFSAKTGHTISLFLTPTMYTHPGSTGLLWGKDVALHDIGGLIAWLASSNPTDDAGAPIQDHTGKPTGRVIEPDYYLSSINGYFELDFGTPGNNEWTTTNFWIAVQNEPDGN
jgi:hypothetical protein